MIGTSDKSKPTKKQTLQAWADVTIQMWEEKVLMLDVWDEGFLYKSFVNHVLAQSSGDVQRIDYVFKLYGIYSDMGVGREVSRGNSGDLEEYAYFNYGSMSHQLKRKAKPWYSSIFYREMKKLSEYLAVNYGVAATVAMVENISGGDIYDRRFKYPVQRGKMISNLKYQRYKKKGSFAITMKEYAQIKGRI